MLKTRIKDSVPLMPQKELEAWLESILDNTHYRDILYIRNVLNDELDNYHVNLAFAKRDKFCDKCEITYPFHTTECTRCHGRLREIRMTDNLKEILHQ